MARIVLMGLGARDAALAGAALVGHEVVTAARGPLAPGANLVISARPPASRAADAVPVIVLGPDLETTLPSGRKAIDVEKLRIRVQETLDHPAGPAPGQSPWLSPPFVGERDAAVLEAALRLGGPVWLAGEAGSGRSRVAGALGRRWSPAGRLVPWLGGEDLRRIVQGLGRDDVLLVPDLDDRPRDEQRLLARTLAAEPALRAVVTGAASPAEAQAAGRMEAAEAAAFSGFVVALVPLGRRPGDVAALARLAASALGFDLDLTEDASDVLQAWPWKGNFAELESVVKRSLVPQAAAGATGTVTLGAADLALVAGTSPQGSAAPGAADAPRPDDVADEAASGRRGVVVDLGAAAASRQARAAADGPAQESAATVTAAAPAPVEGLLAAFAHEIRNPMVAVKTFTTLAAADAAGPGGELARLAAEACDRVDEQLSLLQRLAEKTELAPARIDVVDVLGRAIEAAGAPDAVLLDEATALRCVVDPDLAELVCDALVLECRSRAGAGSAPAAVTVTADAVVLRLAATSASDRLERWVEGAAMPWRLALAEAAARRSGGLLEVDREGAELVLRWKPALAAAGSREAAPAARGSR